MNKLRSFYKNYVIFAGIFTFLAMGTLFVSLLGWLIGGAIWLSFSTYIGLLIWIFLKRSKPLEFKSSTEESLAQSEIRIPLRTSLERLKIDWLKLGLLHIFILIFFNLNIYWMMDEIHQNILILSSLAYLFLAFIISVIKTSHLRKALKLIGHQERNFVLDDKGLSVPIELLNESAIHKALKLGLSDIFIPWTEIELIETFNQVGRSHPQLRLKLSDKNQYADLMGQMAILRTPEVDRDLELINNFIKSKNKA